MIVVCLFVWMWLHGALIYALLIKEIAPKANLFLLLIGSLLWPIVFPLAIAIWAAICALQWLFPRLPANEAPK